MKINDFVKILSEMLEIAEPQMDNDESYFKTNTQIACVVLPKKVIHIRKGKASYDLFFAIAHGMRHIWQFDNKKYNFDKYIYNNDKSINNYNNQDMEIDAHAFSILIMKKTFKMRPQIENVFDSRIIEKIEKRMNEIEVEMSKD